jgi:hypothetical protein
MLFCACWKRERVAREGSALLFLFASAPKPPSALGEHRLSSMLAAFVLNMWVQARVVRPY